ncbi:hypothetical protein TNIN_239911 [Trichonephila inaurata madagascariensis]|uniref:Uncharacterized protein n=1 Tax=Trichonephila inaurata madagascariensis TaxID=2747483 RepID=A0A8X6MM30_9ARAC|nr:hypothetical protein TNIN_239911 [Trichonephila inaurata madagascariensis]
MSLAGRSQKYSKRFEEHCSVKRITMASASLTHIIHLLQYFLHNESLYCVIQQFPLSIYPSRIFSSLQFSNKDHYHSSRLTTNYSLSSQRKRRTSLSCGSVKVYLMTAPHPFRKVTFARACLFHFC